MNKKTGLVVLGIALVGGIVYFGAYSNQSEKPLVVVDKPVVPVSTDQPVAAEQFPVEDRQPTQKLTDSASEATTATTTAPTTTAPSEKQQVPPALEPEIREALGNILNTSSEGLVEETHNGVTSVDLQGRFQTAPVATIDADGNVHITDYSHLPKASPQP